MNLADKPCYPTGIELHEDMAGLTFRERLIIALASNPYHVTSYKVDLGKYLIKTADAIIKELEAEK